MVTYPQAHGAKSVPAQTQKVSLSEADTTQPDLKSQGSAKFGGEDRDTFSPTGTLLGTLFSGSVPASTPVVHWKNRHSGTLRALFLNLRAYTRVRARAFGVQIDKKRPKCPWPVRRAVA